MKRVDYNLAAGIVERIDKLEKKIFELQNIMNNNHYIITSVENVIGSDVIINQSVDLLPNEIATEVFVQNILEYFVNNLNLELEELRKELDEI